MARSIPGKPKKPTKQDTTAPYTFKRGDLVKIVKALIGGGGPSLLLGVVIGVEGDGGVCRGHVNVWTGQVAEISAYEKAKAATKYTVFELPVDSIQLLDKLEWSYILSVDELNEIFLTVHQGQMNRSGKTQ